MGVSKNRGKTPKWMVYKGKPYEQMEDLGGYMPLFLEGHPNKKGFHYTLPALRAISPTQHLKVLEANGLHESLSFVVVNQ